jgi:hypothetical protein
MNSDGLGHAFVKCIPWLKPLRTPSLMQYPSKKGLSSTRFPFNDKDLSIMTTQPHSKSTLADLPLDHSAMPRLELTQHLTEAAATRGQIKELKERINAREAELAEARSRTSVLEQAMRAAPDDLRMLAAAEYGSHIARVADLEKAYSKDAGNDANKLAEMEEQLRVSEKFAELAAKDVKWGEARNAVDLYSARLRESNIIAVSKYVQRKFHEAGQYIDPDKHRIVFDPKEDVRRVGPYKVEIVWTAEEFDAFYTQQEQRAQERKREQERLHRAQINSVLATIEP